MCSSRGYKSLPYVFGLISIMEMIFGILRIIIFFGEKPANSNDFFRPVNQSQLIPSPLLSSTQAKTTFALDWIASIIPTFMGIYVLLFSLLATCSIFVACCCVMDTAKGKHVYTEGCSDCFRLMKKLRFQVRFGLLAFFIFLRIIAIILYASDKTIDVYGGQMAAICTASIVCVALAMGIDLYQYRVWWHYRPDGAYKKCRCFCCKHHFHPSHQRFLPAPLLGKYREDDIIGNRPCEYTVSGNCPDLSLEHIVIFHAFDFKPLKRYRPKVDTTYIGFHRTKLEHAVSIAKTVFRPSMTQPQMLGFGVYFARSFADTDGEARAAGKDL